MQNNKKNIPRSLKAMVWVQYNGRKFDGKCHVAWCKNKITPFDFEAGHNVPESKGGATSIHNLRPICASCNRSMGNKYTIDEYSQKFKPKKQWFCSIYAMPRVMC